jgi:hypothetical protein
MLPSCSDLHLFSFQVSHIWNDITKVQMALMNENFSDLLTVGEEAFLLLVVFDNYMETAFAPKNAD